MGGDRVDLLQRINKLEFENKELKKRNIQVIPKKDILGMEHIIFVSVDIYLLKAIL